MELILNIQVIVETPLEGATTSGYGNAHCNCILNQINVLTSQQEVLFQIVDHVTDHDLRRNIIKTLKHSLSKSSSKKSSS